MREIVRRLLGAQVKASACQAIKRGDDYAIECRQTECRACQVTHVYKTLARKDGKWRIESSRRERRGDTGECGCCQ